MLKVSSKRSRDLEENVLMTPAFSPRSPHKMGSGPFDSNINPSKKCRPIQEQTGFNFGPLWPESPFSCPNNQSESSENFERLLIKPKKNQNDLTERMFSYNEVKDIVSRAVAEREASIKADYDKILKEMLEEQFRSFSKFNEDNISSQFKSKECTYLS